MPVQDFLITFRADTTGAISQINALATRVAEVDGALNSSLARLERRRQGVSPFASLSAGAPAASAGVQRISKELLEFGRNIEMDKAKVDSLLKRLAELKTILATGSLMGVGPSVAPARLTEAISIIGQLRGAHALSALEADKWAQELTDAYGKVGRVSANLRTSPVADQARSLREARELERMRQTAADLQQRGTGTFRNDRAQIQHLNRLEKALGNLASRGDPVQKELDETRRKIDQLEAAAARAKSIGQLLQRRGQLETRLANTRLEGGNDRNIIRSLKAVEEELMFRGQGSTSRLDSIRRQFAEMTPPIDRARERMLEFNRVLQQRVVLGERLNLPAQSAGALTQGLQNGIDMLKAGMGEGADAVEFFQSRVANLPPTLSRAAQGMLNHGRRVAEGLFIYEALGRAMQGVSEQIALINDIAREQIRFAQVAGGIGDQGRSGFIDNLADIAVRTNTPMNELAAQLDSVASAFLDVGNSSQVAATSQKFLNDVGQFTNITTRDLATETENLIGIYKQSGDNADEFSDRIGRIVVAGRNSSTVIQGITDVLSEAGRSARASGFDFDFLTSLASEMVQELRGTMSGTEIGGLLNTVLGRLTDPQISGKLQEIVAGVVNVRDAMGSLRPAHEILIDIFEAVRTGALDTERAELAFDQLVPALNPGARALIVNTLERTIPRALSNMGTLMASGAEDAKNLSDALVSGPGERFATAMKEVSGALTQIFSDDVIDAALTLANVLKSLASILESSIGGAVAGAATKILILGSAFKVAQFAYNNLKLILFGSRARYAEIAAAVSGYTAAVEANTVAQTANNTASFGSMGSQRAQMFREIAASGSTGSRNFGLFAGAMSGFGRAMAGVKAIAAGLLPLLLAMFALEIPDTWRDVSAAGEIQERATGRSRIDEGLLGRGFQVATTPSLARGIAEGVSGAGQDLFGDMDVSQNQFKNVVALSEALIILQNEGKLTANTQRLLEDQILTASGKIREQAFTAEDLIANMNAEADATRAAAEAYDFYTPQVGDAAEALNALTDAEERAAEAVQINAGLTGERAAAIAALTTQLRAGAITVDEWAEGQSNAAQATESAANFVAAYADQLALIPGLQERMASTGESAAAALTGILLDNPDTISERIEIIDTMVAIKDAKDELAADLEANPVELSIDTRRLVNGVKDTRLVFEWLTMGTYETKRVIDENPIEPQIALDRLKEQALQALKVYKVMLQAQEAFNRNPISNTFIGRNMAAGLAARTSGQSATITALQNAIRELSGTMTSSSSKLGSELGALGDAFGTLGGIREGDPRLDSSSADRQPSQTGIIDIGDLPPSAIQQIIALATAAQSGVVAAGGVVDTDETAAIFKDAAFQTLIRGIDQRFLQQAIEELTEVEKKRLELEQARLQDVTRSLVTQVGPIQSIVSAPVLAAGGGVLSGQGLNADPRLGNFTINVPINWSGMSLPQLQEFIYKSISQAWIDAGRGA